MILLHPLMFLSAPFPPQDEDIHPPLLRGSQPILLSPAIKYTPGKTPAFSFDWQLDLPASDSIGSSELARAGDGLNPLRVYSDPLPSGRTMMLAGGNAVLPVVSGILRGDVRQRKAFSLKDHTQDLDVSLANDISTVPLDGLPTPPHSRSGNLRKYSSLNFDELDKIESSSSLQLPIDSSSEHLGNTQSTAFLRKSKSFLTFSRDSLGLGDDTSSPGSAHWTNKLRKRPRPESTASPILDDPPMHLAPPVELPKGLEQIGEGIGYNYRGDGRRRSLILASLTPRTCHGIFTGRRTKPGAKQKQHKDDVPSSHNDKGKEGGKRVLSLGSGGERANEHGERTHTGPEEDEEDLMDEVMREIYGDDWNGGSSPPRQMQGRVRRSAGLGWGEVIATPTRFGMAEDASYGGPDCTLRLVTSPSTPWIDS